MLRKLHTAKKLSAHVLVFGCFFYVAQSASGQSFTNSASLSALFISGKTQIKQNSGIKTLSDVNNFLYAFPFGVFPRFNAWESNSVSLSIGSPLKVGFGFCTIAGTEQTLFSTKDVKQSGYLFTYDLPLVADVNFGAGSSANNDNQVGGYLGAGYGYTFMSIFGTDNFNDHIQTKGLLYRAGMCFRGHSGQVWSIGGSFKKGTEDLHYETVTIDYQMQIGRK